MSLGEYYELINKPKQQRCFVRWSYKDRPSYNGRIIETYSLVDCNKFDEWLEKKRDKYLCFDLLIVNKM